MTQEEENILNGNANENFDKILEITSKLKVPASAQGKEDAWDKLMQSIEQNTIEETKIVPFFSSSKFWYSIAATLIVLITIASLSYRYTMVEFQLSKGDFANKVLPDGSEVKMNADSKIEYRKFGWLSERIIKLNGEALFSVKHGNRFTVITEFNRKITVTGTKFNVFARGKQFEVKCFEGSVLVETSSSKPVALVKGKGVSYNIIEETPSQFVLDSIAEPTWTKGEFYFNDTPLNLVFDEVSRQFNVSITANSINPETRKYTGFFKRNSIKQALDLVCIPMGITYQISPDSTFVTIKK